jgi:hypothetical protein
LLARDLGVASEDDQRDQRSGNDHEKAENNPRLEPDPSLEEIAAAIPRGEVAAAVVIGGPGNGKSRLLDEIANRAEHANLLRVVGYEPEQKVPLASAAEPLRALTELAPAGETLGPMVFTPTEEASPLEPLRVFEAAHRAIRMAGAALVSTTCSGWTTSRSRSLPQPGRRDWRAPARPNRSRTTLGSGGGPPPGDHPARRP